MTREQLMWLPLPRDPGIGPIRRLCLGDRDVSHGLGYWRQRAANGDRERWEKLLEQKRINEEVARQEREDASRRAGQGAGVQA